MVLVKDLKKVVYNDFEIMIELDEKIENIVGFKIDKEHERIILSVSKEIKFKEW